MRDWTQTLFLASFRGVPFWVRRDGMETGRRLDGTEIPGSDIPFFEDLGAKKQPITIQGYLIGDVSDAQMAALEAACGQAGPGTLVMPAQGPATARCSHIKRNRDRDEMGKFAFDAEFFLDPRSGFAAPQAAYPGDYLAQLAFSANDNMAASLTSLLGGLQL